MTPPRIQAPILIFLDGDARAGTQSHGKQDCYGFLHSILRHCDQLNPHQNWGKKTPVKNDRESKNHLGEDGLETK